MEQKIDPKTEKQEISTNEKVKTVEKTETLEKNQEKHAVGVHAVSGVFLSEADAEEFRTYKKRKALSTIASAIARSEGSLLSGEDVQRVCERAVRLRQSAVKVPLSKLTQAAFYLGASGVKLDCVVGGTGETLAKVKGYETRVAVRKKASEITLVATPSVLDACRYGELRKEIKKVRRAAKKASVKVRIEKILSPTALTRVARVCSETGVRFLSVPYFQGCERLRLDLTNGCLLEVTGVETTADYKRLIDAGIGRIVTDRAWEIYAEWLRESGETATVVSEVRSTVRASASAEKTPLVSTAKQNGYSPVQGGTGTLAGRYPASETDYRCRLEGTQLKFL